MRIELATLSVARGAPWTPHSDSEVEAVVHLTIDLTGIVVVEPAECDGIVEQHTGVGDVDGGDGGGEVLAEGLAEGEVPGSVLRQVGIRERSAGVGRAVHETGAVVDVRGGGEAARECGVEADVQSVALVVVD